MKISRLLKIDGDERLKIGRLKSKKITAVPLICHITLEFKYPYAFKPAAIPTT